MSFRTLANGARLPNWVYLVGLGFMLGVQGAWIWLGNRNVQQEATQMLVAAINHVAERDSINYTNLRLTLDRRTTQINTELHLISVKTGYIARQVE